MGCPIIYEFRGDDFPLSSFYPVTITFAEETYPSLEHAYHALKTANLEQRKRFQDPTLRPGDAKKMGKKVTLRKDWNSVRVITMANLLEVKFGPTNLELRKYLASTSPKLLIEGNLWHDNFWGICFCPSCRSCSGTNKLGQMLMNLRETVLKDPTGTQGAANKLSLFSPI